MQPAAILMFPTQGWSEKDYFGFTFYHKTLQHAQYKIHIMEEVGK